MKLRPLRWSSAVTSSEATVTSLRAAGASPRFSRLEKKTRRVDVRKLFREMMSTKKSSGISRTWKKENKNLRNVWQK